MWASLLDQLAARRPPAGGEVHLVELGAGIGTMVERLLDWGLITELTRGGAGSLHATMELVDNEEASLAEARRRLPRTAQSHGWTVDDSADRLRLTINEAVLDLHFRLAAVDDFLARRQHAGDVDLVLAHAFLDLFDLAEILPPVLDLLRPAGLFWFTITFDGATILEPELEGVLDRLVQSLYHESMDGRLHGGRRSGDARAGRHLFHTLTSLGAEVVDLGSSDWVVFPRRGRYPAEEAYFLHAIITTIAGALTGDDRIPPEALYAWVTARHDQVERGELLYVAHQLDVLGRRGGDAGR